MVKRLFLFTFLLTLLIILIGCDNGSVSDSAVAKSNSLVKVCLTVDGDSSGLQKTAGGTAVDGSYWASLTYQYNAVPQWRSPDGAEIHGTAGWTTISYEAGMSLGYFAPGHWVFGVRVLHGATVLYEGFSDVISVENSHKDVDVFVTKLAAESVRISVTVPTAQGDSLSISYEDSDENSFGPFMATATRMNGTTTFEYTINNLANDTYTFTFTYSNTGSITPIQKAISAGLSSGKMAVISGQLDNNDLQLACSTVNIYRIYVERYDWDSEQFKRTGSGNYYGAVIVNTVSAVAGDLVSFYVDSSLEPEYPKVNDGLIQPTSGNLYSFIMPDSDAIVKVKFENRGDTAISLEDFKTIIQAFYDSNPGVKAFGRSVNPPIGVEYLGLGEVSIWYDGTKIYWYSNADDNTVKFIPTILVEGNPTYASMKGFFENNDKFESIDLTGFNTSNINDMSDLFYNCANLKTVNMGNIDTSKVEDMSYMFYKAGFNYFPYHDTGLNPAAPYNHDRLTPNIDDTYLQITGMGNNFDTSKVENMSHMFNLCSANDLSGTNIASWNVSKVEYMDYMFAGYGTLKSPYLYWYNKFQSLPISGWQTTACKTFERMFEYCNVLETMDMSNWSFAEATSMNRMFDRCESLTDVIFPTQTNLAKMKDMTAMFFHCNQITYNNFSAHVFTRWDIRSTVLYGPDPNDPETVEGKGFNPYNGNKNDTPNRIFNNNMHNDFKSSQRSFVTFGTAPGVGGATVKIGGGNLNNETKQRLIID